MAVETSWARLVEAGIADTAHRAASSPYRSTAAATELTARAKTQTRAIIMDTSAAALGGKKEDDEGLGRLRMLGERIHAETARS